jgi:hypothetical protein
VVTTPPPPVLGHVTVTPKDQALRFSWSAPTGGPVEGYSLSVGNQTVYPAKNALTATVGVGVNGDTALTDGASYPWTLVADGFNSNSTQLGKATPIGPPAKATELSVAWHKVKGHVVADVHWQPPADNAGHPWQTARVSDDGKSFGKPTTSSGWRVAKGFKPGHRYEFSVRYTGPGGVSTATLKSTAPKR